MEELIEFATFLARDAGSVAMSYFGKNPRASWKSDGTIVTIADREAEQLMRARIEERFPSDGIVGEEFGVRAGTSPRRWIIDPIDGTFSFARGVPIFGVLVGLECEGVPTIGVVNLPAVGEIASAAVGRGCYLNGVKASTSSVRRLDEALLLCGDFLAAREYGLGDATERLQEVARARRGWGDCYAHVLVATGRADIALDPVTKIWDCAALAPILGEAGGTFTDWHGVQTIDGGNAISTNGAVFEEVIKIVRASSRS